MEIQVVTCHQFDFSCRWWPGDQTQASLSDECKLNFHSSSCHEDEVSKQRVSHSESLTLFKTMFC